MTEDAKFSLQGIITSIEQVVERITSILGSDASEYSLTAASATGSERSEGKAVGPYGDEDTDTLPNGQGVFKGELKVAIGEDLEKGTEKHFYFLYDRITNKLIELKGELPPGLGKGAVLKARGNVRNGVLTAGAGITTNEDPIEVVDNGDTTSAASSEPLSLGVILGNFNDKNVECSVTEMQDRVFGTAVPSLESMSNGQWSYTGDTYGTYTIDYSSTGSSVTSWMSALRSAAEADGVNLNQYDTLLFVLPRNGSGWGGYAYYGGDANTFYCKYPELIVHELGHTIYNGHAGFGSDVYGDRSDFMGNGYNGVIGSNSVHQGKQDWLPSASILVNPSAGEYTLGSNDSYTGDVTWPQVLKIAKADTDQYYYVSYRTGDRYSSNMPDKYKNTVQIHLSESESIQSWSNRTESLLLASLADGESFSDGTNGITVTRTGSVPGESATIDLDASFECVAKVPTVDITPAEIGSTVGGTAEYSVSITNNNGQYCGSSNIDLTSSDSSTGLTTSLFSSGITLESGSSGSVTLSAVSDDTITGSSHTVSVMAAHNGGSGSDTALYTLDAEAPTVPANVSINSKKKFNDLVWNASSDNVGVAGYEVVRDGQAIGTTDVTSFRDKFPPNGSLEYRVRAFDAAGNYSDLSEPAGSGTDDTDETDESGPNNDKCTPGAQRKGEC